MVSRLVDEILEVPVSGLAIHVSLPLPPTSLLPMSPPRSYHLHPYVEDDPIPYGIIKGATHSVKSNKFNIFFQSQPLGFLFFLFVEKY